MAERPGLDIREPHAGERDWVADQLHRSRGSPVIARRGASVDASGLPALAVHDGAIGGLATFEVRGDACELVTLNALAEGEGAGSARLEAVTWRADAVGCRRLWLITTNDNLGALRFYQRRGMRLVAVHAGAVDEARRRKPSIPQLGRDGIPIHDELELERRLDG